MEVIHIRVSEVTEDSRDVGRKQLVRGFVVPKGSREADFLDELQPVGDEIIINKSSSGVFPVTNLDRLLRNMGITTLDLYRDVDQWLRRKRRARRSRPGL